MKGEEGTMSKGRKLWTVVAAVMLAAAMTLAACSDGGSGGNSGGSSGNNAGTKAPDASDAPAPANDTGESGTFVLGSEPLEFTFYGHYDWYAMPPWGEDITTKWIKEEKKVNIIPIQSGGNANQKLSTMIASNDLPDVIWMDRFSDDMKMLQEAGMLVPFDDYLDKYPNLKQWLGDEGINMLRSPDGKLYQFPNWYTKQPNGNAGYVVNKKIYEELGSPKLETTDDLYAFLKAVKANYPNVIPFEPDLAIDGQGLDVLYSAFGENALNRWLGLRAVPNGDKLTSVFLDPVYRESMQYASKLFREKLMTQDALTQTKDQVKEKINTGRVAVYASASPTDLAMEGHSILSKQDPNAGYIMIWPIAKPGLDRNKIFPGTFTQLGWNVSVITKAAEDPEKIFAFLDWYTGPEGQSVLMWGPPGIYWDGVADDGITPIFTEKYTSDAEGLAKLQAHNTNFHWNGNTVFVDTTKAKFEASLPVEKRNWATHWQYEITWKTQADATEFINTEPPKNSEEGIIATAVEDIWKESRARALYANSDEEVLQILDKAHEDAMAAGYQKLLDYKTKVWQSNLKQMKGH